MSDKIQGEGDYEAAERFNKAEQDFIKHKLRKQQKKVRWQNRPLDEQEASDGAEQGESMDELAAERDDAELLKRFGIEVPRRVE